MHSRLVIVALCLSATSARAEHLVSSGLAEARLIEASTEREENLSTLNRFLRSSQAATSASRAVGGDVATLRTGLASLSDQEIAELAARATALEDDPAGGLSGSTNEILVVALIVLIVLLVLKAV